MVNQAAVRYSSQDNVDQVLYSAGFTITATLPGNTAASTATGIGQFGLPIGLFSYDNGATWNDCAGDSATYSQNNAITIKPPFTVNLSVSSDGSIRALVAGYSGTSGTYTVLIKYVILALNPGSSLPSTSYPVITTNPVALTTTQGTYRKIYQSGLVTGTNDGAVHTITHSIGSIPLVNSWSFNNSTIVYNIQSCFVDSRWQSFSSGNGHVIALTSASIQVQFIASIAYYGYPYRIYGAQ